MITCLQDARGAGLERARRNCAVGCRVASGGHLTTNGHWATRGTAALPTALMLCCCMEPPAPTSAQALEVRGSTRASLRLLITTSIVHASLTSLVLMMPICLGLLLGGLPRSEAAHSAAELGFFFTVILAFAVTVVDRDLAFVTLATSSTLPVQTVNPPGGRKDPPCAAVPYSRAALHPRAWHRKMLVQMGAHIRWAPTTGAGESMLDALRRLRAAILALPIGAAGAALPEAVAPRNALGRLSASSGTVAVYCRTAVPVSASSMMLLLGRRRRRRNLGTRYGTQAGTRKEQETRGEPTVSIKLMGNGVREAVGAAVCGLSSSFASASTASAREPRGGGKVGVAGFGLRSTSAATPTLGRAAEAEVDPRRDVGVGVQGFRAFSDSARTSTQRAALGHAASCVAGSVLPSILTKATHDDPGMK